MVGSGWIVCFGIRPFIDRLTVRYRVQMSFGDPVSGFAKIVKKLFRHRRQGSVSAWTGGQAYRSGSVSAYRRGRAERSSGSGEDSRRSRLQAIGWASRSSASGNEEEKRDALLTYASGK